MTELCELIATSFTDRLTRFMLALTSRRYFRLLNRPLLDEKEIASLGSLVGGFGSVDLFQFFANAKWKSNGIFAATAIASVIESANVHLVKSFAIKAMVDPGMAISLGSFQAKLSEKCVYRAIGRSGSLEIYRYFENPFMPIALFFQLDVFAGAAERGHLALLVPLLNEIRQKRSCMDPVLDVVVRAAASCGQTRVLQYLHEHRWVTFGGNVGLGLLGAPYLELLIYNTFPYKRPQDFLAALKYFESLGFRIEDNEAIVLKAASLGKESFGYLQDKYSVASTIHDLDALIKELLRSCSFAEAHKIVASSPINRFKKLGTFYDLVNGSELYSDDIDGTLDDYLAFVGYLQSLGVTADVDEVDPSNDPLSLRDYTPLFSRLCRSEKAVDAFQFQLDIGVTRFPSHIIRCLVRFISRQSFPKMRRFFVDYQTKLAAGEITQIAAFDEDNEECLPNFLAACLSQPRVDRMELLDMVFSIFHPPMVELTLLPSIIVMNRLRFSFEETKEVVDWFRAKGLTPLSPKLATRLVPHFRGESLEWAFTLNFPLDHNAFLYLLNGINDEDAVNSPLDDVNVQLAELANLDKRIGILCRNGLNVGLIGMNDIVRKIYKEFSSGRLGDINIPDAFLTAIVKLFSKMGVRWIKGAVKAALKFSWHQFPKFRSIVPRLNSF